MAAALLSGQRLEPPSGQRLAPAVLVERVLESLRFQNLVLVCRDILLHYQRLLYLLDLLDLRKCRQAVHLGQIRLVHRLIGHREGQKDQKGHFLLRCYRRGDRRGYQLGPLTQMHHRTGLQEVRLDLLHFLVELLFLHRRQNSGFPWGLHHFWGQELRRHCHHPEIPRFEVKVPHRHCLHLGDSQTVEWRVPSRRHHRRRQNLHRKCHRIRRKDSRQRKIHYQRDHLGRRMDWLQKKNHRHHHHRQIAEFVVEGRLTTLECNRLSATVPLRWGRAVAATTKRVQTTVKRIVFCRSNNDE
jgi:hypothetical protein